VTHDVIVLGAGAAGLFAAAEAGRRGRRVVVLERAAEPGRKILISGGGRCNFTNIYCRPENFLSGNPHFARSALARYTAADFIALVERHGIRYHEKTLGQLFCDGSSTQILEMLLAECASAGVGVVTGCDVAGVSAGFSVETSRGRFEAPRLIVATGGLSIPRLGATDLGYRIARAFGIAVVPPRPALVPLVFDGDDRARWTDLAGVATTVGASANGVTFRERLLVTHRGLSGPAVLQASSYWQPGEAVEIDLLPGVDLVRELSDRRAAGDTQTTKTALGEWLPRRFADRWFEVMASPSVIAATGNDELSALSAGLHAWRVRPAGTEGFAKAEVTAGGVDTRELSSQTMEARRVPGLHFIGEVVDVTGHLGGFNFQWAWASAHAAGNAQ
jgi:predicted Rossmann fold flavoprotein